MGVPSACERIRVAAPSGIMTYYSGGQRKSHQLRGGANRTMNISVVIPVYNSESTILPLVERLSRTLTDVADAYEVVLVNDGSHDRSWEVISDIVRQYDFVRGVNLMRNCGQHNALLCGIRLAQHAVTITIDDDLQHPPEEIPKLIAAYNEGFDVVYGTPATEQHGFLRNVASRFTKFAIKTAARVDIARDVSAFRIFHTRLRDSFANFNGSFVSIDVLLTWGATRYSSVQVAHESRSEGNSNYTFRTLFTHAFNMITGFSTVPLQIASLLGFILTAFGGMVLVWVVGRYLVSGVVVPGFAFLASIVAIFSGAQLFALGVMGEYIARMYMRLMDRPAYVVVQDSTLQNTSTSTVESNTHGE